MTPVRARLVAARTGPAAYHGRDTPTRSPGGGACARHFFVHDQAAAGRHVRHGGIDALAGLGGRHGGAGEGRQRVRRRGRDRPGAAGRRAAPERAGRRGAGDRLRRGATGEVFVLDGQGAAPAAATLDAFAALGLDLVPGTGLLPAVRARRAFGTWMLLLAAARPAAAARRDAVRDRLRPGRLPDAGHGERRDRLGGRHVPRALAELRRGLPARRRGRRRPGERFANPGLAAAYSGSWTRPRPRRPTGRRRSRPRGVAFYEGFVAEAIAGSPERAEVMDVTGQRAPGPADRRRTWPAGGRRPRPPVTLDYHGPDRVQDRAVGAGPGVPAAAGAAGRLRPGRDGAGQRGPHPHRHRVRQARVRRPRGLVRRPAPQRRAAGRAAVGRVRGAAAGRWWATAASARPGPGHARRRRAAAARVRAGRRSAGRTGAAGSPRTAGTRGHGVGEPTGRRCPPPELGPGDTCHLDVADSVRQPGVGHAERRLAAELAGHPRARVLPGHPRRRCSRSPRAWPAAWRRAGGRGPRCRRAWRCAAASRTWRSAPPAGTSRTSGRSAFFLNHVLFGMNLQEAIDAPAFSHRPLPVVVLPARVGAAVAGRGGQGRRSP